MMPQLYLYCQDACKQTYLISSSYHSYHFIGVFTDISRWAGARVRGSIVTCRNIPQPCGHTRRWTSHIRCFCLERMSTKCQHHRASPASSTLPQTKCAIWTDGDVLTAAGDLPVGLIAAVVIKFGVRVVQDGPALGMLHGIGVTLVVYLAAPWQSSHQTFETGCTVAWSGINPPEYWPVQIVHGCAGASISAVAAVVGVVQGGPAIGHHTQDHFPELVEGQVVQRLTWKQENQLESETLFRRCFPNVGRFLTDGKARSHEEHNLEGIHPGVCQEVAPTLASLYIKCGTLVLLCQLFTLHVVTHTPKCTCTLRELTWTWVFGGLEERQGWKQKKKKTTLDVFTSWAICRGSRRCREITSVSQQQRSLSCLLICRAIGAEALTQKWIRTYLKSVPHQKMSPD